MIGRPEPVDPPPNPVAEPLPPAREQLPLPRRRQQAHLEPQLREPGGAGAGTPFAAFASPSEGGPALPEQAADHHDGQPSTDPAEVDQPTERIQLPTDPAADRAADGADDRAAAADRAAERAAAFRAATRRGRRPGPPTRPARS